MRARRCAAAAGRLRADERGAVTAEFAVMLPAAIAVLGLMVGAISLAAHRIGLVSVAGEVARLEARGDASGAEAVLASRSPIVTGVSRVERGPLLCVELTASPGIGPLRVIPVSARSCAALASGGPARVER